MDGWNVVRKWLPWRVMRRRVGIVALLIFLSVLALPGRVAAQVGAITWHTLPAPWSWPGSIVTGSDGALWFAETGKIGRMTTSGALTEYKLPSGIVAGSITRGPDGAIWFADVDTIGIVRIGSGGTGKEYHIPGGCNTPYCHSPAPASLIAGPNSTLWFIWGIDVVKMTLQGAFTKYPLPSGGTRATTPLLLGLGWGADGNIWATDGRQARVWRITPSGGLSYFHVPVGEPTSIIPRPGPGGALWLLASAGSGCCTSGGRLVKMTTAGAFTEFTIAASGNGLSLGGITAGPDGNLWFSAYNLNTSAGEIVRSTPTGAMSVFALPTYVEVDGITSGPDGGIWFGTTNNQTGVSRIGRMATA